MPYTTNAGHIATNGDISLTKSISLPQVPFVYDFRATFVDGTGNLIGHDAETGELIDDIVVEAFDYNVPFGEVLDETPPDIDPSQFRIEVDGVSATIDLRTNKSGGNLIDLKNAVTDTLSKVGKLYIQPMLESISTTVGTAVVSTNTEITDSYLSDW